LAVHLSLILRCRWEDKVARQSKTLKQAIIEYERRYRRSPPKGFDDWCAWAVDHVPPQLIPPRFRFAQAKNVTLIDEYDSIDTDIRPFLALQPPHLQDTMREYAGFRDVETLVLGNAAVQLVPAEPGTDGFARTQSEIDLIEDCCAAWLQPANVSLSASDGPSVFIEESLRAQHLQAVRDQTLLSREDAETVHDHPSLGYNQWHRACDKDTQLRKSYIGVDAPTVGRLSFIRDHLPAMDPCNHPDLLTEHGGSQSERNLHAA
jgi:hypothetical protein